LPLSRDVAILHFLATWSAARTAPYEMKLVALRRPYVGFNPQIYAHHQQIEADINPLADFISKGRPQGPWVHSVIRPLTYYPEEPIPDDGTILHALERLLPFIAAKEDLSWVTVHIPGVIR